MRTIEDDVLIIGGGPAGYAAALGLAQEGRAVRIVERAELGGTCLHRGCIPTKALLESARLASEVARAGEYGLVPAGAPVADWPAVRRRQQGAVQRLASGLRNLVLQSGVRVDAGHARLLPPGAGGVPRVRVAPLPGGEPLVHTPRAVVLAPGAHPVRPPIPGIDRPGVVDSDGLLALPEGPRRLCVIGGGAIGCEFATAHADLGCQVTIVEMQPQLLPAADPEIARRLAAALRRRGITVLLRAAVRSIDEGPVVSVQSAEGDVEIAADVVLVAVGRAPATLGLGLSDAGVGPDGRAIAVGADFQTAAPRVYAAGDALGGAMVAHGAFFQAEAVVASMQGRPARTPPPVPQPVFCRPEVAWVGMTETAAAAAGPVRVARLPYAALGRAHAAGEIDGMCKLVADESGRLLGVHVIGERATETIGAAAAALASGATAESLSESPFPHPTFGEALREAAALMAGHPLHVPRLTR